MKKNTKTNIKLYTFDQVFKKKTGTYRRGYEAQSARITLAQKIREEKTMRKLTQSAVARKAHMPQSVIARIESGEHGISVDTLARIAHALDKEISLV
ncbi:MAG: helix-turn-helix transcriptional regulator [bacterium]|nr:helix-turn-helix transcriptional regulator [bacterium]